MTDPLLQGLEVPEDTRYVMTGDSDIERLHNRLNPPGTLGVAASFFGGMNTGYYSGEDANTQTDEELGNNAKYIADLLSVDDERAMSVLRLIDSAEDFEPHPIDVDLLQLEISQEDLAANSLKALKTIFGWTKSMAKQIFNEMTNLELVARYLSFHAANIQTLARDRRGTTAFTNSDPLILTTRIANLSVRYAPVKDVAGLLTALRILNVTTKGYFDYNNDDLLKIVDRLPSLLGDADSLESAISGVSPAKLLRNGSFYPGADNGVQQSGHLLGCHRLSVRTQDGVGMLDQRYTVRLVPSDITPRPLPDRIEFKRFTIQAMDQVLNIVVDLAEYLQEVNTPMVRQRRMARLDRLALITTRVAREIEAGNFDPERHRKVIAVVNQYNDWITSPYKELYGLVCRDLRAVLNVCELNAQ